MKITPREFIEIWQRAATKSDVLVALAPMAEDAISQRAARYRALGIPLKDFRSQNHGYKRILNVAELSEFAATLEPIEEAGK